MRRLLPAAAAAVSLLLAVSAASASSTGPTGLALSAPSGLAASVAARSVELSWDPAVFPNGVRNQAVIVARNGATIATLAGTAVRFSDRSVAPGGSHSYTVATSATYAGGSKRLLSPPSAPVRVSLPAYLVGAAAEDISTPPGEVINQGGNGIGDGRGLLYHLTGQELQRQLIGRGSQNRRTSELIQARAVVFDDGRTPVAIANIETQGWFAAYQDGPWGTVDMAQRVAAATGGRLAASNIIIASDHTHAGPDTVGAWGGMPAAYMQFVTDQVVRAITRAYDERRFAHLRAGQDDAGDIIYNQSCPEALYQSRNRGQLPDRGWEAPCVTAGKDRMLRVLQATAPSGETVVTYVAFAAHATEGGGDGVHGDWPQFLADEMSRRYGGTGIAMQGAVGRTQPCRPVCAFTDKSKPGAQIADRKTSYVTMLMHHVGRALAASSPVNGPVAAAQARIREVITGPAVLALFAAGEHIGARLMRSNRNPWVAGNTIATITSALRVGDVLIAGTPGEGYPEIAAGISDGVAGEAMTITLGLANDQLGYLIARTANYVPITAQVAVNDNTVFNVSPTIGDHVMCSDIALARRVGFAPGSDRTIDAYCAPFVAADAAGDPVGATGLGGPTGG